MFLSKKIVPLTIFLTLAACCTTPSYTPQGIDISDVVKQIKLALVSTQKELTSQAMPGLASVKITLSLVKKAETSGEVDFLVLSGGATHTSEETQKIVLTLKPPAKDAKEAVSGTSLREALVNAIVAAGKTSSAANKAASEGEPKLNLTTVTTSVKFSVTDKGNGGVGFVVGGLTLGVKHSSSIGDSHEIEFTFQ